MDTIMVPKLHVPAVRSRDFIHIDPAMVHTEETDLKSEPHLQNTLQQHLGKRKTKPKRSHLRLSPADADELMRKRLHSQIRGMERRMDLRARALNVLETAAARGRMQRLLDGFSKWKVVDQFLARRNCAFECNLNNLLRLAGVRRKSQALKVWKMHCKRKQRTEKRILNAAAKRIQAFQRGNLARKEYATIRADAFQRRTSCLSILLLHHSYRRAVLITSIRRHASQRRIARIFREHQKHQQLLYEQGQERMHLQLMHVEEQIQRAVEAAAQAMRSSSATLIQRMFLTVVRKREEALRDRAAARIQHHMRSELALRRLQQTKARAATLLQKTLRTFAEQQQKNRAAHSARRRAAGLKIQQTYRGHLSRMYFRKQESVAVKIQCWIRACNGNREHLRRLRRRYIAARQIQVWMVEMLSRLKAGRVIVRSVVFFLRRRRVVESFNRLVLRVLVRDALVSHFLRTRASLLIQRNVRKRQAACNLSAKVMQKFVRKKLEEKHQAAAAGVIQRMFHRHERSKASRAIRARVKFRVRVRICIVRHRATITLQCAWRRFVASKELGRRVAEEEGVKRIRQKENRRVRRIAFFAWQQICIQRRLASIARTEEEHNAALHLQRFARGWRARKALQAETLAIASETATDSYSAWRVACDMRREWELHSAAHQRLPTDLHKVKRIVREEVRKAEDDEKQAVTAELKAWRKRLIPEEDPSVSEFAFYFYNSITGQTQATPPRGFIDKRREEVENQGPPNPDDMAMLDKGWKRQFLQEKDTFVYVNRYTKETRESRPAGYIEEESEEQRDENRSICECCEEERCTILCEVCSDTRFCWQCFFSTHRHPALQTHPTRPVFPPWIAPEDDPDEVFSIADSEFDGDMCSRCQKRANEKHCDDCGDSYCSPCFEKAHNRSRLAEHRWRAWAPPEWEEIYDEEDDTTFYFNQKTKERLVTKPLELQFGWERARAVEADKLRLEVTELEDEISAVEEQISSLETFKAETLKEAREKVQAYKDYQRATATSTKLAKLLAPSLVQEEKTETESVQEKKPAKAKIDAPLQPRTSQPRPAKREHASQRFSKVRRKKDGSAQNDGFDQDAYLDRLFKGSRRAL